MLAALFIKYVLSDWFQRLYHACRQNFKIGNFTITNNGKNVNASILLTTYLYPVCIMA